MKSEGGIAVGCMLILAPIVVLARGCSKLANLADGAHDAASASKVVRVANAERTILPIIGGINVESQSLQGLVAEQRARLILAQRSTRSPLMPDEAMRDASLIDDWNVAAGLPSDSKQFLTRNLSPDDLRHLERLQKALTREALLDPNHPNRVRAFTTTIARAHIRARQREMVVNDIGISAILPTSSGAGFRGIFGSTPPSGYQIREFARISSDPAINNLGASLDKRALFSHIERAPQGKLNILICHNAGSVDEIKLALPSGERVALAEIEAHALLHSKNIAVICCYARQFGINKTITASQAVSICKRFVTRLKNNVVAERREAILGGSVDTGHHMAEIYPALREAAGDVLRSDKYKSYVVIGLTAGAAGTVVSVRISAQMQSPKAASR